MRSPVIGSVTVLLLMVLGTGSELSAQTVLVRVSSADTGRPIHGALVYLSGGQGAFVSSALTNERGQFLFAGLEPETYAVRVEMIGHATQRRAGIVVGGSETQVVDVALATRAIELAGIGVEGEVRCRLRPEDGLQVAQVWDEARKALEAARWTEERGVYEYALQRFAREVEDDTRRVIRQERSQRTGFLRVPYESRSAQDLMDNGFVQSAGRTDEDYYYAPDAGVLLSAEFLDVHCMRLRIGDGEETGLVGVAFEPIPGRRQPDISGVFWMDPNSWQLQRLSYTYVNVSHDMALHGLGGEVRFQRLPNGTWIVPDWVIRMPWISYYRDAGGIRRLFQAGYREEGGTVLRVREPGGAMVLAANAGTLEGVVLDSLEAGPIVGATVRMVGTDESIVTDDDGRFRFVDLPAGTYDVTFSHPDLDELGYRAEPVSVEVAEGQVASVSFRSPGRAELLAQVCDDEVLPENSTVLLGWVREAQRGLPLENATVRITWDEFRFSASSDGARIDRSRSAEMGWNFRMSSGERGVEVTTSSDGFFRACIVPELTPVRLAVRVGPFSAQDTLRTPEDAEYVTHELVVGTVGSSMVVGRVEDWSTGEPVVGAEVRVMLSSDPGGSTDGQVGATGADGAFSFSRVNPGRYMIEVGSLGYATVSEELDAEAGRIASVVVRLPAEALEIEGLTVEVESRVQRLELRGFYERRQAGVGAFLDLDAIEESRVQRTSDLFTMMPGVRVAAMPGQLGVRVRVLLRNQCIPAVFLDGVRVRGAGGGLYLDEIVHPSEIAGIEVYRAASEQPLQFGGTIGLCGVLVIWTR